mgnify:CR=1 FL=1
MAGKNYAQVGGLGSPKSDYNWQCEEDVRTLTRAAEVLADKGRMSMAMKKFKKTQIGVDKLVDVLSSARRKRY